MLHIEYSRKDWERKRQDIFKRDKNKCRICGKPLGNSRSVHHKCYPDKSNDDLLSAHVSCHSKKHYQERKGEARVPAGTPASLFHNTEGGGETIDS